MEKQMNEKINRNRWILFRYEFKKIVCRKMVWVCIAISLLLIGVTVSASLLGNYYVNKEYIGSNYEMWQQDKAYQLALDGREIDGKLLGEMQAGYGKVDLKKERYSLTEEYQTFARPYSAIYNFVRQSTGKSGAALMAGNDNVTAVGWDADAESLREMRLALRELRWEENLLTEGEKEFWRQQEEKIVSPVVFRYAEGYSVLLDAGYTIGLLGIFTVAVCLSGMFSEEHVRRTDQLILSSRLGRKQCFAAKFGAGLLFSLLLSLFFCVVTFAGVFLWYGAEGFGAAFQLIYAGSSLPISVGCAVLIQYFGIICASVFTGALTMWLSQVFGNGVGALGVVIGMIMLPTIITMPEEYRVLGQLWSYLPSDFVAAWSIFSPQTVPIFGIYLQAWQAAPVLYCMLGAVFGWLAKRSFVKYQISGR